MINKIKKEIKIEKLINQYKNKREDILKLLKKVENLDTQVLIREKLERIPRNASIIRLRKRCPISGRARGYLNFFGLSRHSFRKLALSGYLPGVVKSSW